MAERKYVRTIPGMRIDQPDFNQAAVESQRQADEQLLDQMFMDPDFQTGLILGGFDYSHASGIVTITRGRAIVSYRDNGQIRRGMLIAEGGPVQKQLSVAALANGTYTIYLRGKYSNVDPANRVVWNADATTPVEVGTLMATRVAEDWDLLIALSASVVPAEWIPLYQVVVAGSIVTSSTDLRNFFFEGTAANSFAVTDAEFGDTNDRSTARGANGVTNIRKAIRGLQRQVQDIIGQSSTPTALGWWKLVSAGDSLFNKLNRDGTNRVTGQIYPDADNTIDFGRGTEAFRTLFNYYQISQQIAFDLQNTAASDLVAGLVMSFVGNDAARTKRQLARFNNLGSGINGFGRIYIGNRGSVPSSGTFYIQIVHNAVWSNSTNLWSRVQAGDSYILELGTAGINIGRHSSVDSTTWADTFTSGTWTPALALNGISDSISVTGTGNFNAVSAGIAYVTNNLSLGALSGNGVITAEAARPTIFLNGGSPAVPSQLYFGGATAALELDTNDTAIWEFRLPVGFTVTALNAVVSGSTGASRTFALDGLLLDKTTNTIIGTQSAAVGPIATTTPVTVGSALGAPTVVNGESAVFAARLGTVSATHIHVHHVFITGYLPNFAP